MKYFKKAGSRQRILAHEVAVLLRTPQFLHFRKKNTLRHGEQDTSESFWKTVSSPAGARHFRRVRVSFRGRRASRNVRYFLLFVSCVRAHPFEMLIDYIPVVLGAVVTGASPFAEGALFSAWGRGFVDTSPRRAQRGGAKQGSSAWREAVHRRTRARETSRPRARACSAWFSTR